MPVVTWEDAAEGVLVATMDHRPANALGPPIIDGLNALLDETDRRHTRVLVLTSAIPGFFAAGADIKHMGTVDAEMGEREEAVGPVIVYGAPCTRTLTCRPPADDHAPHAR